MEIDPKRVEMAQLYTNEYTFFRLGGFNLPLQTWPEGEPETIRLICAFNVLRQYNEQDVEPTDHLLSQHFLPGRLIIEGTSSPLERIWVANILRTPTQPSTSPWFLEALVFSTNFRQPFDPVDFQTVLPKNYIHRVVPGEAIYQFFQAWKQATHITTPFKVWGSRQCFKASAQQLATYGYPINTQSKWLTKGYLIWKQPPT